MSLSSETGHAVNANNFVGKVNRIKQEGEAYNPSNPQIQYSALEPLSKLISDAILGVSQGKADVTNAIMTRKDVYVKMDNLATRAVNMLKSSGASRGEEDHASFLLSKYKGERIGDVPNEEEIKAKASAKGEEPVIPKTISVSQQGFVNKLNKFKDIVVYLKTILKYNPNEEELTIAGMEKFITSVGASNDAKDAASKVYTDALVVRNTLMYKEPSGAYYLQIMFTKYVGSAFGKKSQFYLDLQKFPITHVK